MGSNMHSRCLTKCRVQKDASPRVTLHIKMAAKKNRQEMVGGEKELGAEMRPGFPDIPPSQSIFFP